MKIKKLTNSPEDQALRQALFRCHLWNQDRLSSFTAKLFDLALKADVDNFEKLTKVFPHEMAALTLWHQSEDEDDFEKKLEELGVFEKEEPTEEEEWHA